MVGVLASYPPLAIQTSFPYGCPTSPPFDESLSHTSSPEQQRNQHLSQYIVSDSNNPPPSPSAAATSDTASPKSTWTERSEQLFYRNLEGQINALIALPEAERRKKARVLTATTAERVCQLRDQASRLRRMRPDLKSKSQAYDKQVAGLRSAEKACYTAYIRHLCLTFRFNELPMEVLTEIFRYAACSPPYYVLLGAVIRLTHVCRLWRSVVIADRRIWNSVCFGNPNYVERTFTLMGRAGPTNIDIQIRDTEDNLFSKDAMTQLIDRLSLQLPSIRRLEVFLHSAEAVIPILNGLPT